MGDHIHKFQLDIPLGRRGHQLREIVGPLPWNLHVYRCQVMLMLLVWETLIEDHCLQQKLHIRVTRCSDI